MAITIISFSAGTTIRSADMNTNFLALTNALSGVNANNFIFLATANTAIPLTLNTPSVPGADTDVLAAQVTADTVGRASLYVRTSDGYGGLRAGVGASYTANLYAQAAGWLTPQPIQINQTLGGANQFFMKFDATDGRTIALYMNHFTNSPYFYSVTNSQYMQEFNSGDSSIYVSTGTATPGNYFAQLASAGGGNPGKKVWVGSTDPGGSATEGDLWING